MLALIALLLGILAILSVAFPSLQLLVPGAGLALGAGSMIKKESPKFFAYLAMLVCLAALIAATVLLLLKGGAR